MTSRYFFPVISFIREVIWGESPRKDHWTYFSLKRISIEQGVISFPINIFMKGEIKMSFDQDILIVIEKDGSHHLLIPNNDELEFEPKAYKAMVNTLTVLDSPSFVLRAFLWVERLVKSMVNNKKEGV